MCDDKKPEDALLNLYGMLCDQLHKNSTLLWQIPTALFVANALALDKFKEQPYMLLPLSLFDFAMTYACYRVYVTQRAIISAVRNIESELCNTSYKKFTPVFVESSFSAPYLIVVFLFVISESVLACFLAIGLIDLLGKP